MNFDMVRVDRFYLMVTNELCSVSHKVIGKNASGSLTLYYCLDKQFFSYNGKKYTNHPSSANDHYCTTLGTIDNQILAVGGYELNNNKVELFNISSNTWTTKTPFPYCSSR